MPDIPGDFESQIAAFLPQTPQDHIKLLEQARTLLRASLAELPPNKFVIALRHPDPSKNEQSYFVAHSGSFGYYIGSLLNAQMFDPPFDVKLNGFRFSDGVEPKPEVMSVRIAMREAFEDIERQIEHWKGQG